MGLNGRRLVEKHYDIEKVKKIFVKLKIISIHHSKNIKLLKSPYSNAGLNKNMTLTSSFVPNEGEGQNLLENMCIMSG